MLKIREQTIRIGLLIIALVLLLLLNSCADNSGKLVIEAQPSKNFEVDELIETLHLNTSNYRDKVVVVRGVISDINTLNNRNTIILRGEEQSKTLLICDMQKGQDSLIHSLKLGDTTTIKGILKGSLKDVIILHCVISNHIN
ncbi:OB-fold protein [Ascidiimonas sp. W6]|uniref:OB-fold protein n=1 Tax=Ascidiimonas meishanensis TaxID=3128903 RepID=UPI0030EEED40